MKGIKTHPVFQGDSGRVRTYFILGQWVVLVVVLCGFASATLITRILLAHSMAEPDTLMAMRYSISAIGTAGFGFFFNRNCSSLPWKWTYIYGGVLIATQAIFFGIASKLTDASLAGLCFFGCASLTAALIGSFLKRHLPILQFLGLFFGFIGLITVLRPSANVDIKGTLCAVLGGFAWGGYILWSKYQMPTDWASLLRATGRTMAIGSILVWIFALMSEPHGVSIMDRTAWWSVVYIGLLPQAIGLAVLNWLAFRLNHIQLSVSLIGTPLFVVIGGVTLLNEPSTWTLWMGLGLVITGMVLASTGRQIGSRNN